MKKFYQTVSTKEQKSCCDEYVDYEGEDLEKAKSALETARRYNDKDTTSEIREYELEDNENWDDLDDARKCDIMFAYNTIDID